MRLELAERAYRGFIAAFSDAREVAEVEYQLVMTSAITSHFETERGGLCRTNSAGVCVVQGAQPRGPACFEPTVECLAHLGNRDRWPSTPYSGIARTIPLWRMQ